MQRYKRPDPPDDFDKVMENHRQRVERLILAEMAKAKAAQEAGETWPPPKKRGAKKSEKEEEPFQPVWGKYKVIFALAQFSKCGFCDNKILASQHGDVEHYRPKAKVSELKDDPATYGQVFQASATVKGRSPEVVSQFGYWWDAYEWKNYLLACQTCNQTHKGTLFPVLQKKRTLPPQRPSKGMAAETPLLLNPYEKRDPTKHLKFLSWGAVTDRAGSPYGKATILICGLDRPQLLEERKPIAISAFELAQEILKPVAQRNQNVWRDCYRMGRENSRFSGMVQTLLKDVGKVEWQEVVETRAHEIARALSTETNSEIIKMLEEEMEGMGSVWFAYSENARDIYQTISKQDWGALIERRADRLSRELRAARDAPTIQYTRRELYNLAWGHPEHAAKVKATYEQRSREKWESLQSIVEAEIIPVEKLKIM